MNKSFPITPENRNIVLIGMPSSGKSTIGPLLAHDLGMGYIDTDKLVEETAGKKLGELVSEDGLELFLKIQEKTILNIDKSKHVIATGGSVVYSAASMQKLKDNGVVVYLEVPFAELSERLDSGRRLARNADQSLEDIYLERISLYRKYSDITVDCSKKELRTIVSEIIEAIGIT